MAEPNEQHKSPGGGLDRQTMLFIAFLAVLFFGAIAAYFSELDESLATVRATRPVLVFTLIVAMLGFGGMLMFKSLFGTEPHAEFEQRFRLAREVFLVYAGIFGTIIGFYFGAADEDPVNAPLSASFSLKEGVVSAQVTGGVPPFLAYLQRKSPKLELVLEAKGGDRLLVAPAPLPANECPNESTLYVVDGAGSRSNVEVQLQDISSWPACAAAVAAAGGNASGTSNEMLANGAEPINAIATQ